MMKRGRFSDEQIVRILRVTEKDTIAEVAKRYGVSKPTIYSWRKKLGAMETFEVKRWEMRFVWPFAQPVNLRSRP